MTAEVRDGVLPERAQTPRPDAEASAPRKDSPLALFHEIFTLASDTRSHVLFLFNFHKER